MDSVSAIATLTASSATGQQALKALQGIPQQLATQSKAAAEARLQQLIETYRKLAPIADPQTLAFLAKEIGIAARALGESVATADLPASTATTPTPGGTASPTPAPDSSTADATGAQADSGAKTILVEAGTVVEAIRRRLAFAAAAARNPDALKEALSVVGNAARAVATALNAVGGPFSPVPVPTASQTALNLVA